MEQEQITLKQVYEKLLKLEIFMKKMNEYIEDLEFARRTEEAWEEIDQGKYTTYNSPEEFLSTLKNKNDNKGK